MFYYGLLPLIDKPSRITKDSATLIDNIFTNVHGHATCGLLLSDLTDHLPIFVISQDLNAKCSNVVSEPSCNFERLRTPETIEGLKRELINYNWDKVHFDDPTRINGANTIGPSPLPAGRHEPEP